MKTRHGALFLASANMSRTRLAPTPTNISTKSEPAMEKNGTPASPAMALARSVLPVPGGPAMRMPWGILPPRRPNFFGSLRYSTTSTTSSLASSHPATSLNVVFSRGVRSARRARLRPKPSGPLGPRAWRKKKNQKMPTSSTIGRMFMRTNISRWSWYRCVQPAPARSSRRSKSCISPPTFTRNGVPSGKSFASSAPRASVAAGGLSSPLA